MGRFWDGRTGNQGGWDEPDGYRTLIHEFGHYALFLYDEYFAYTFDQGGNLTGEVAAYCTGPENRNPAHDARNTSVMDYQYSASELAMRGVPGMWSTLCEQTAQWQLNGESDWETLRRHYGDVNNPPRWLLTTPADRGSLMSGPVGIPANTLPFPLVTISDEGLSGLPRGLTVQSPQGRYRGALVALYTNQEGYPVAIDQGFTDLQGEIDIYGAQPGDTLRAASFDGALSGSVSITDALSYTLVMAPASQLHMLSLSEANPHLALRPSSDGAGLYLKLFGLESGGTLAAIVTQSGGADSQPTALTYTSEEAAYVGAIRFSAIHGSQNTGTVQVIGSGGGSQGINLNSTYALQNIPRDRLVDLFSVDGNLQIHLITGTLPVAANAVIASLGIVPTALPPGRQLVGNVYDVKLSGLLDARPVDRPFILTLNYDPEILRWNLILPNTLAIYRWDPAEPGSLAGQGTWVNLSGSSQDDIHAISVATDRFGVYALMGTPANISTYLPVMAMGPN